MPIDVNLTYKNLYKEEIDQTYRNFSNFLSRFHYLNINESIAYVRDDVSIVAVKIYDKSYSDESVTIVFIDTGKEVSKALRIVEILTLMYQLKKDSYIITRGFLQKHFQGRGIRYPYRAWWQHVGIVDIGNKERSFIYHLQKTLYVKPPPFMKECPKYRFTITNYLQRLERIEGTLGAVYSSNSISLANIGDLK